MPIRMPFPSNLCFIKTFVFKKLKFQLEMQDMQTNIYNTNQKRKWGGGGALWVRTCGQSGRQNKEILEEKHLYSAPPFSGAFHWSFGKMILGSVGLFRALEDSSPLGPQQHPPVLVRSLFHTFPKATQLQYPSQERRIRGKVLKMSLVAQLVKNLPVMRETWVQSLGWEDPLEKGRLPLPVFWPRELHGLYNPWGRKESDTTEQLSLLHFKDVKETAEVFK